MFQVVKARGLVDISFTVDRMNNTAAVRKPRTMPIAYA